MSRIGKAPISLPDGVKAELKSDVLTLEGPKGQARLAIHPALSATLESGPRQITLSLREKTALGARAERSRRAMWGTANRLIANAVKGVVEGYTKELQIVGVGYGARLEGGALIVRCGFANEVRASIPEGVTVDPPRAGNIMVTGVGQMPCVTVAFRSVDKRLIGEFAASVRRIRPPEPYKNKGIRYTGEEIRRKAGKALAAGTK